MSQWLLDNIGAGLLLTAILAVAAWFGLRYRVVHLWDRRAWPPINRVPRTEGETRRLLAARPPAWEYLHFAGELLRGLAASEPRYLDHRARVARASGLVVAEVGFGDAMREEIHSILLTIANWERLINGPSFEEAVGRPGEPGDPDRIAHLADRLTESYVRTMDWSARLRGAHVAEVLTAAVEILSRMPDQPVEQYRAFVHDVVARMDGIPALLRDRHRTERVEMTFELVLSVADDVMTEWEAESARLST